MVKIHVNIFDLRGFLPLMISFIYSHRTIYAIRRNIAGTFCNCHPEFPWQLFCRKIFQQQLFYFPVFYNLQKNS